MDILQTFWFWKRSTGLHCVQIWKVVLVYATLQTFLLKKRFVLFIDCLYLFFFLRKRPWKKTVRNIFIYILYRDGIIGADGKKKENPQCIFDAPWFKSYHNSDDTTMKNLFGNLGREKSSSTDGHFLLHFLKAMDPFSGL